MRDDSSRVHTPRHWCLFIARSASAAAALLWVWGAGAAAPFAIQGPGVNPGDFRITVFASGLSFPLGMAQLADGSLLVTVAQGTSFWNGPWQLLRLTDTNQDGVADGPGTVLF